MFASFHSNGTIPASNDKLNTVASGMFICSTISSSNLGGIPSTPGDLFFIFLICLATMLGVLMDRPYPELSVYFERTHKISCCLVLY